jgi:Grx4 family monothiol glutaredoxin
MSTLTEITSEPDFDSHLASLPQSALLVLSFHTPWALPCTQMQTVLSTLASTYPVTTPPTISFVSINAEELPDISEKYDVTAVPFLVLIQEGQVLESLSGSDASKVRDLVEKYAGNGANGSLATGGGKSAIPPPLDAVPRKDEAGGDTDAGTAAAQESASAPVSKEELFARLADLVKAAPVMLFMKGTPSAPQCGFSRQLVGLLRENGVKYGFFNILADEDVRQGLKEFADWPTFPQLWVKGELVGGLDIVSYPPV